MSAAPAGSPATIVARRAPPPPPRIRRPSQEKVEIPPQITESSPTAHVEPAETANEAAPAPKAAEASSAEPTEPSPVSLRAFPKPPGRGPSASFGGAVNRPAPPSGASSPAEATAKDPAAAAAPKVAPRPLPRPVSMFPGKSPLTSSAEFGALKQPAAPPPRPPPKPQIGTASGAPKKSVAPTTVTGSIPQGAQLTPPRPNAGPKQPSRPVSFADASPGAQVPLVEVGPDPQSPNSSQQYGSTEAQAFAPPLSQSQSPSMRASAPTTGSRVRPISQSVGRPSVAISRSPGGNTAESSDAPQRAGTESDLPISRGVRPRSPSINTSASEADISATSPAPMPFSPPTPDRFDAMASSAPVSPNMPHRATPIHGGLMGLGTDPQLGEPTFIQMDLDALDLEALYPSADKNRKKVARNSDRPTSVKANRFSTLRSFGATMGSSLKGIVGSSSSTALAESPSIGDEDPVVVNWPSVPRTRRQWTEPDLSEVPSEVLSLIDRKVLETGFHIETGDANAPREPTLEIDHKDEYVSFYKDNLYSIEHSTYIGADEDSDLYYIISCEEKQGKRQKLRVLIRTRKDYTRVLIDGSLDRVKALKAAFPDLAKVNLTRIKGPELPDELAKMEQKEVVLGTRYKFGVLYALAGQTEDEIFANENPSADFEEFLNFLGDRITLQGWNRYTGGLDVKSGSTGEQSVFKEVDGIQVMFHVCTLLPAQQMDTQRVERKRHIGNDVVTFVFKEGDEPFVPTILTSQFIHIVVVVQKIKGPGPTRYAISISTKFGVEPHIPTLSHPAVFEKSAKLRDMLLYKCINAERTAMLSPEFRAKMMRARKEFLKLMYQTFSASSKK